MSSNVHEPLLTYRAPAVAQIPVDIEDDQLEGDLPGSLYLKTAAVVEAVRVVGLISMNDSTVNPGAGV